MPGFEPVAGGGNQTQFSQRDFFLSDDFKQGRSPTSPGSGKTGNVTTSLDDERDEEYFCLRPPVPGNGTFSSSRSDDSDHNPDVIPDALFLSGGNKLDRWKKHFKN